MEKGSALRLVSNILKVEPVEAIHQSFGHNSITFDVELPIGHVIVRMNPDAAVFRATSKNIAILRELGIPVPTVLAED